MAASAELLNIANQLRKLGGEGEGLNHLPNFHKDGA